MKNKNYDPMEFNNAYNNTSGFDSDPMCFNSELNKTTSIVTPSTVVVETGKLNLRKEPNFKSTIICVLDRGTELSVIGDVEGFYEVKTKSGITGYTSKNFVK